MGPEHRRRRDHRGLSAARRLAARSVGRRGAGRLPVHMEQRAARPRRHFASEQPRLSRDGHRARRDVQLHGRPRPEHLVGSAVLHRGRLGPWTDFVRPARVHRGRAGAVRLHQRPLGRRRSLHVSVRRRLRRLGAARQSARLRARQRQLAVRRARGDVGVLGAALPGPDVLLDHVGVGPVRSGVHRGELDRRPRRGDGDPRARRRRGVRACGPRRGPPPPASVSLADFIPGRVRRAGGRVLFSYLVCRFGTRPTDRFRSRRPRDVRVSPRRLRPLRRRRRCRARSRDRRASAIGPRSWRWMRRRRASCSCRGRPSR